MQNHQNMQNHQYMQCQYCHRVNAIEPSTVITVERSVPQAANRPMHQNRNNNHFQPPHTSTTHRRPSNQQESWRNHQADLRALIPAFQELTVQPEPLQANRRPVQTQRHPRQNPNVVDCRGRPMAGPVAEIPQNHNPSRRTRNHAQNHQVVNRSTRNSERNDLNVHEEAPAESNYVSALHYDDQQLSHVRPRLAQRESDVRFSSPPTNRRPAQTQRQLQFNPTTVNHNGRSQTRHELSPQTRNNNRSRRAHNHQAVNRSTSNSEMPPPTQNPNRSRRMRNNAPNHQQMNRTTPNAEMLPQIPHNNRSRQARNNAHNNQDVNHTVHTEVYEFVIQEDVVRANDAFTQQVDDQMLSQVQQWLTNFRFVQEEARSLAPRQLSFDEPSDPSSDYASSSLSPFQRDFIDNHSLAYTYQPIIRSTNSQPEKESCTICLDVLQANNSVRRLQCMHLFHADCIDSWLVDSLTCPVCRCLLYHMPMAVEGTSSSNC